MKRDKTVTRIFDAMEKALALEGFKLLDGNDDTLIIREPKEDRDYQIKVEEIVE